MKEISPVELAKHNGKNGNPAYLVHEGAVYDVTESKLWKGGIHMQRHHAGEDLTLEMQAAPHGPEVLKRYPEVAKAGREEEPAGVIPEPLLRLITKFPRLKRHPHPMIIHFPIVYVLSAAMFTILYFLTGVSSFELTACYCLGGGLIFTPVAMGTGYYTWFLNYRARPLRPVTIKQRLSWLLLGLEMIAFTWRLAVPDIVIHFRVATGFYLIILFSLCPLVAAIGWFGAELTFPVDEE